MTKSRTFLITGMLTMVVFVGCMTEVRERYYKSVGILISHRNLSPRNIITRP